MKLRWLNSSVGDGNQTTLPMGTFPGMEVKLSQEETSALSPPPVFKKSISSQCVSH